MRHLRVHGRLLQTAVEELVRGGFLHRGRRSHFRGQLSKDSVTQPGGARHFLLLRDFLLDDVPDVTLGSDRLIRVQALGALVVSGFRILSVTVSRHYADGAIRLLGFLGLFLAEIGLLVLAFGRLSLRLLGGSRFRLVLEGNGFGGFLRPHLTQELLQNRKGLLRGFILHDF